MVFLGVEPGSVRVVLAEGLCDLGGITSAEGLRDGEAGRAPFICRTVRDRVYIYGVAGRKCEGTGQSGRVTYRD
jgi:hypothetical protein